MKERPHEQVERWIVAQDEDDLFLSVATLLELRVGVELAMQGKNQDRFEHWLVDLLPKRFEDRIIPVEKHVADLCGRILARSRKDGWQMESMDALIGLPPWSMTWLLPR